MGKANKSFLYGTMLAGWLVSGRPTVAVQMIADRHFQDGAKVLAPVTGEVEGVLQYKEPYGTTWWSIAQWTTEQSIYGTAPTLLPSGSSNNAVRIPLTLMWKPT